MTCRGPRKPLVVGQLNSDLIPNSKNKDVTWFQIAMHYVSVMQHTKTLRYLVEDVKYQFSGKKFTLFHLLGEQVL